MNYLTYGLALALFANNECSAISDADVVFRAGEHGVTFYLARKHFTREVHGAATLEQKREWLQRYRARQVVTSAAHQAGYFAHPDVLQAVSAMEDIVLTQQSGPYWSQICASARLDVRRFTQPRYSQRRGTIRRFAGVPSASGNGVDLTYSGVIAFPFRPFVEICPTLSNCAAGSTTFTNEDGVSYRIDLEPSGDIQFQGRLAETHIEATLAEIACAKERLRILRAAQIRINNDALSMLMDSGANGQKLTRLLEGVALFTYRKEGETSVAADRFLAWRSRQFVKRTLGSESDVIEEVHRFVVDDHVLIASRARGDNKTLYFQQDRYGYHAAQALERYRKDVIEPNVRVGDREIVAYYNAHQNDILETEQVVVKLRDFPTHYKALEWMQAKQVSGPEPTVVTAHRGSSVAGVSYDALKGMKEGTRIVRGEKHKVAILEICSAAKRPATLAEATGRIRELLTESEVLKWLEREAVRYQSASLIYDQLDLVVGGTNSVLGDDESPSCSQL